VFSIRCHHSEAATYALFFFLEHAGELRIFVLREKERVVQLQNTFHTLDYSVESSVLEQDYYKATHIFRTRPQTPPHIKAAPSPSRGREL